MGYFPTWTPTRTTPRCRKPVFRQPHGSRLRRCHSHRRTHFAVALYAESLRRIAPATPRMPVASNPNVPGSGVVLTTPPPVPPTAPAVQVLMVLSSSVTAPVSAMALPQLIVAPVARVMLVLAMMFPTNEVVVPRVAELPTSQYTLSCAPAPSMITDEPLSVVSVSLAAIWKTKF